MTSVEKTRAVHCLVQKILPGELLSLEELSLRVEEFPEYLLGQLIQEAEKQEKICRFSGRIGRFADWYTAEPVKY
jgi:hypothetical protein